jgi:hypothetical protein
MWLLQPLLLFSCHDHSISTALLPLDPSFNLHNHCNSTLILRRILIKPELSLRCHRINTNPSNLPPILILL